MNDVARARVLTSAPGGVALRVSRFYGVEELVGVGDGHGSPWWPRRDVARAGRVGCGERSQNRLHGGTSVGGFCLRWKELQRYPVVEMREHVDLAKRFPRSPTYGKLALWPVCAGGLELDGACSRWFHPPTAPHHRRVPSSFRVAQRGWRRARRSRVGICPVDCA